MRKEFTDQFAHFWRTFRGICEDFDPESWRSRGYGLTQPDRLAIHILQSTLYYLEDMTPFVCADGTVLDKHSAEIEKEDLPDQETILFLLQGVEKKTEDWLGGLDFGRKNEEFPWTGENFGSVALFLLRHSQHHLGEMNALLNEQLKGKAEDHFANQL